MQIYFKIYTIRIIANFWDTTFIFSPFNSDQGSQYTSYEHTQMLKDHNIQISMNGKGRSIDNIAIERFFRTLKHNNIYISGYKTIKELKEGVKAYIHKYNLKRFHSSINYQKPINLYLEFIKNAV